MQNYLSVKGRMIDEKTVVLEEAVPISAESVEVLVKAAAQNGTNGKPREDSLAVLERIWAEQKARGFVPRTQEEVEAYLAEERDWGPRHKDLS